jgi:1-acyl-sn-glycerol-3-phosphate acyltransferase
VGTGPLLLDIEPLRTFLRGHLGMGPWPGEDLLLGLVRRFVRRLVLTDPVALAAVRNRPVLYLANHQVGVESMLWAVLATWLGGPTLVLAKAEHRESWIGRLRNLLMRYPGSTLADGMIYFDRSRPEDLLKILRSFAGEASGPRSLMVHVEGTRSLSCRRPVEALSAALLDLAMEANMPIVPLRFAGGLPIAEAPTRLEFPVGHGGQDYFVGAPVDPAELRKLPLGERKQRVLAAMNDLGPGRDAEVPLPPDPSFAAAVSDWMARSGAGEPEAVLLTTWLSLDPLGPEALALADGIRTGAVALPDDDRGRWLHELATWLYGPRGPRVSLL